MEQKLLELFNFCGENKIDFIYETGESGENEISYTFNKVSKTLKIKINNPDDEHLGDYIDERILIIKSLL